MEKYSPFTNKNNYYINKNNINLQNNYNFRNFNQNFGNKNNYNNNYISNYNNNCINNNMCMNFNKESKIARQSMRNNKTPMTKDQNSFRGGNPYYNYSNKKDYNFNSPPALAFNRSKFPGLNNIQPFNLNNYNGNYNQNQAIKTNNNNIKLNNNINTNKSKDNKINDIINNANKTNQDNLTSREEEYTLEALRAKRIFKTKTKNNNQMPINQKLQFIKNKDNNITEEPNLGEKKTCKDNTENKRENTAFYINQAFDS